MHKLILASQSPRRKQILEEHGFEFTTFSIEVSEIPNKNLNITDQVCALAQDKAEAAKAAFKPTESFNYIILSADTVVVHNQQLLGKPQNTDHARLILEQLSGSTHEVITGFCLIDLSRDEVEVGYDISTVVFKNLQKQQIMEYIDTGEPMDKAGAYGIQGQGRELVESYQGSFKNIVGLPIEKLESVFLKHGWDFR